MIETLRQKKKIPVAVLGATGSVGQKFIQLLDRHPWFEIAVLAASERSAGRPYGEAVNWVQESPMPGNIANMKVFASEPGFDVPLVFSALDAAAATGIEKAFAREGYMVISNARSYRQHPNVPLMIPEVNSDHLAALEHQPFGAGGIVTNPNCSTTGMVMALKPLHDLFGLEQVHVVTLQALSGAGYPGVSSLDALDNVVPFISGEEGKMESEPKKLLGRWNGQNFVEEELRISASCHRVPVLDGHMESISVKLKKKATEKQIIEAWESFRALPQELKLPTAPKQPLHYFSREHFPQPRIHRNLEKGMAVSIGRLRPCSLFDFKFSVLVHNTIRGAAGGAILNAEMLVAQKRF